MSSRSGEPVTLREAAQRFEEAGVAPAAQALASLQRCKPGRAPIYRDGDRYALDPHDAQADLWASTLGLRPPMAASLPANRPAPEPLPTVDAPLTVARSAHAEQLARMRRVLIHAFPTGKPQAVVLVDVAERGLDTFWSAGVSASRLST